MSQCLGDHPSNRILWFICHGIWTMAIYVLPRFITSQPWHFIDLWPVAMVVMFHSYIKGIQRLETEPPMIPMIRSRLVTSVVSGPRGLPLRSWIGHRIFNLLDSTGIIPQITNQQGYWTLLTLLTWPAFKFKLKVLKWVFLIGWFKWEA